MNTLTGHEFFLQLLHEYIPSGSLQEKDSLSWSIFLQALESFSNQQAWVVEYESPDERSCTIFANEEAANKQLSLVLLF